MDIETESLLIKNGLLFTRNQSGKITSQIVENQNGIYIFKDFVFDSSEWFSDRGGSNTPLLMTKSEIYEY